MKHQALVSIAAGCILLILAAFFSISIISYMLATEAAESGLVFSTGNLICTVYGITSIFIPVFFCAAAFQCFFSRWSVKNGFCLLTSCVPFFTATVIERMCRNAIIQQSGVFLVVKLFSTLVIGILILLLEIVLIVIFAEKAEAFARNKFVSAKSTEAQPSAFGARILAALASKIPFLQAKTAGVPLHEATQEFTENAVFSESASFFSSAQSDKTYDNMIETEEPLSVNLNATAGSINWQRELAAKGSDVIVTQEPELEEVAAPEPQIATETQAMDMQAGIEQYAETIKPAPQELQAVEQEPPLAEAAQEQDDTLDEDFFDIDMNAEDDEERAMREQAERERKARIPVNMSHSPLFDRMEADILAEVESTPPEELEEEFEAEFVPQKQEYAQEDDDDLDAAFDSYTQAVEEENSHAEQYAESAQYAPPATSTAHGNFAPAVSDMADEHGSLKDDGFDDGLSDEEIDVTSGHYDDLPEQDIVSEEELDMVAAHPASLQEAVPRTATQSVQASPIQQIPLAVPHRQKYGPYSVPVDLLQTYPDGEYWIIDEKTQENAEALKSVLREFKIAAEVTGIRKGPVITMFELLPAPGVKLSKIVNLQDNIALRLAAQSVRIVAPIPGKRAVGIEVPNPDRAIVSFREIIGKENPAFEKMGVPVVLGKDISGEAQLLDLTKTPHLLIAGSTGAGKSVCVNSIILSILYKRSPQDVKLILIDPKVVELKLYNDIPHLLTPVITQPKRAFQSLQYCLCEMERRYALLDGMSVRDIVSYNRRIKERGIATEKLPYIIVIIDEFADLMATTGKELEQTIARLAAMSRAVGIHLVLATQRPSVDVITGLIKANIPSRIAFMVSSKMDSRIIIDQLGAEKLLGKGDMLYAGVTEQTPVRIQGTFISDTEVENVVEYVKQYGEPDYIDEEMFVDDDDDTSSGNDSVFTEGEDPLYEQALDIVIQAGKASASYIQRRLKIGYNRAARLVEQMEERGIVGPANGSKPREIIHMP